MAVFLGSAIATQWRQAALVYRRTRIVSPQVQLRRGSWFRFQAVLWQTWNGLSRRDPLGGQVRPPFFCGRRLDCSTRRWLCCPL